MVRVFMDESGVHGDAPATTTSDVWARPSVWKEWCRAKSPIPVFHASECHGRNGEFEGWTREERDALILRLLPIFAKHKLQSRLGGVHLDAYRQCIVSELSAIKEAFGDPYVATIFWTFRSLCQHITTSANGRKIAIVHEVSNYEEDIV